MNLTETFGPVWDASGARGFFGEGYWHHGLVPGLSFKGSTFVAKTTTTAPTKGNMVQTPDFRPLHLFPDCIWFDVAQGMALNSVGLTGPGIANLLAEGRWFEILDPFFISWMPVGKTLDEQIAEAKLFVSYLQVSKRLFCTKQLGLQLNVSCPNVGADLRVITEKAGVLLAILAELQIPIVVKINLLVTPEAGLEIARHPACSGICISNSVPFGTVLPEEFWKKHFPSDSPLLARNENYGKGGLSGKPLLPYVENWVRDFRTIAGKEFYVNAGGGIMSEDDAVALLFAGADSIFLGTVAMLRPWRVRGVIDTVHKLHHTVR